MFTYKRYQEFLGALLIILSAVFLVSAVLYRPGNYQVLSQKPHAFNVVIAMSIWVGHMLRSALGYGSFCMTGIFILAGLSLALPGKIKGITEKALTLVFLTVSSAALLSIFVKGVPQTSGGYTGLYIERFLGSLMGGTVTYIAVSALNIAGLIAAFVAFLPVDRGHYSLDDGIIRGLRNFMRHLSIRQRGGVPLNTIGENLTGSHRKPPWLMRKRIVVLEADRDRLSRRKKINYLEGPRYRENEHDNCMDEGTSSPGLEEAPTADDLFTVNQYRVEEGIIDNTGAVDDRCIEENEDTMLGHELHEAEVMADSAMDETSGAVTRNRIKNIYPDTPDALETVEDGNDSEKAEFADNDEEMDGEYLPDGSIDTVQVFDHIPINEEYIIPTQFLNSTVAMDSESWQSEIKRNSVLLIKTLADFGIESKVINVNRGPVITLYELQIAPGIKVNRIVSLADDLAMALAASRVRVVAPIPGKSAIGVEIPNGKRETVTLGDIIKSKDFQSFHGSLAVAIGKDILGKPIMVDLKTLPHLLIAGATGSGKSVCVNSIITSLIYNYDPNYVRFILVDPKMVELQLYDGLPHLLTPVITEHHIAPMALKWLLHEMERRYRLLSSLKVRDIERYNEKVEIEGSSAETLPFIVTIIDELADLMMIASKEIEGCITRIAQKARAVGIHLVLATQRPSVDIITGIIKANFPARVAFQVPQKTDSRTIIDQNGAEKLLGKGDMLYQSPMSSFPVRIQGGYISEDEIEKIVNHCKKMGKPAYIDIEEHLFDDEGDEDMGGGGDELFVEALKIVEETRKASASYLQRRLSIGYNRAARIIEQMEELGYIGPQQGSKAREVFI